MNNNFNFVVNMHKKELYDLNFLSITTAKNILDYHKTFPVYQETPLTNLKDLAKQNNVKAIYIKDESYRFDLNAFKVLGGSYALGRIIAQKANIDNRKMTFNNLKAAKENIGELTFVTATDGNHGRGLAWSANQLGYNSVVYMPKGSAIERQQNIQKENSECTILDMNYDDAVRLANKRAEENKWVMVQDTAWENYEEIPTWIMQGYVTLAYESYLQLEGEKPTHIFLQAGVGSLAGAICGFFASIYKDDIPKIVIVEPNTVDCIYQTALANDGTIHKVVGDLGTIMAGLACGEPNPIAWPILQDYAHSFLTCPDYAAADGMRILANPIGNDKKIISGESGAAPFGSIMNILHDSSLKHIKDKLEIKEDSKLLFINSEGDTDKKNYFDIVWHGKYTGY